MAGWLMLPAMAGEPDDNALMLRYRAGDTVAFGRLYERHKGPLYRYFLRQCGHDRELAADLFQEVWTRVIRARLRYEPSARFTTWMYGIAHNCLVDHWRRRGRRPGDSAATGTDPATLPAADCDATEQAAAALQGAEQLRAALETLPAEQREAILLREEGGLSLAEIAGVTGVATETVKSRLRYALRKLRASLKPAEPQA